MILNLLNFYTMRNFISLKTLWLLALPVIFLTSSCRQNSIDSEVVERSQTPDTLMVFIDKYIFSEYGSSSWRGGSGALTSILTFDKQDQNVVVEVENPEDNQKISITHDFENPTASQITLFAGSQVVSSWQIGEQSQEDLFPEYRVLAEFGSDFYEETISDVTRIIGGFAAIEDDLPGVLGQVVGVIGCGGGKSLAERRSKKHEDITWPSCSDTPLGTDCGCLYGELACCCVTWFECVW